MGIIWRKVWRDLAHNKARTTLAVLSTAVGIMTLGLVFGLSGVMRARLTEVHRASIPAHITLRGGPFSADAVRMIRHERDVLEAEGAIVVPIRWKFEGERNWRKADVVAREDYEAQHMNLVRLQEGRWPVTQTLSVERLSAAQLNIPLGTTILVKSGSGQRRVPIEGIVHAADILAPDLGGEFTFFATPETVAWLTDGTSGRGFNRLHVRLKITGQVPFEQAAREAAARISGRLERMGAFVEGYELTDPDRHRMQEMVDAILAVLAVMGALSLALSAFLIINTMNAIIAQQVWQIGVMKTIGATRGQVSRLYLTTALIYGGLALLLAVPLGIVVAYLVAVWLLGMFNVETVPFRIVPVALGIQVAVGLAVPFLAALVPALAGARTTAHQAISTHGIGAGFGRGRLDRLLGRMQGLPPLLVLSLRNTFRHKARLALTLVTLTLSGIMFIVVMSVGGSFDNTMRIMFKVGGDVSLELAHPQQVSRLIEIAERVPGGSKVEVWSRQSATLSAGSDPREQRNDERYPVWLVGVPADSAMFTPRIVSGRSLRDGDERAVLVNHQLAAKDGIGVGDGITLIISGERSEWTVVGSYLNIDTLIDELYVPLVSLASTTGTSGQGTTVMVRSQSKEIEPQQKLIKALNDAFTAQGIEVDDSWSASKQWQEAQSAFGALTYLLLTMAILTAVVGGIGLMSTISINVVERAREIGMMRAIGATSLSIVGLFISEGVQVGVLSWLLAVPLSYPSARLFSDLIGDIILQMPLDFVYSAAGVTLWLLIVATLSALASLWPALRAAQVSVREALAYE